MNKITHYCLVSYTQSTSEIAFEERGGGAEPGSGCLLGLATGILLWIGTACQHSDPTISLKIRFVSTFLLFFFPSKFNLFYKSMILPFWFLT